MANPIQIVSAETHSKTKIIPNNNCSHAKDLHVVSITLQELGHCSNNFPVVFVQNPDTQELRMVALFGFEAGENLYFGEEQWDCFYMPLTVLRHPFIIGPDENSEDPNRLTTCLEMDSPYVSEEEGELLYKEDGTDSELLTYYRQLLGEIFNGEVRTQKFISKLNELGLISPLQLGVARESGEAKRYAGLFTIDEKKFNALDKSVVGELHEEGILFPVHLMLNSLSQLHRMVKMKNARSEDKIAQFEIKLENQEEAPAES